MQPKQSIEFFQALRNIEKKAQVADLAENATVQSIRRINETLTLVDATPEIEERALGTQTYLVPYPNKISNGDFETDLTSWTEEINSGITATIARTTDESKSNFGSLASLEVDITASSATNAAKRYQDVTAAAAEVWSFELWMKGFAFTNAQAELQIIWLDSGDAVISTAQVTSTDVSGSFVQLKLENQTAPALTAKVRVGCRVKINTSGGTAKAWFDLVRGENGPTTITDRARRIIAGEWVVRT